jgi:hypothetical protein
MSAVNHQFRLAVRWRNHSHRPRGGSLDSPWKLAKSNAEQVARATPDRRESRHCLTMINGRCAQIADIQAGSSSVNGVSFGMGSRNRSGRRTGAGRVKELRRFRVRLSDLVSAVRLIAQPAACEQHFDQESDEGAHREKQR